MGFRVPPASRVPPVSRPGTRERAFWHTRAGVSAYGVPRGATSPPGSRWRARRCSTGSPAGPSPAASRSRPSWTADFRRSSERRAIPGDSAP